MLLMLGKQEYDIFTVFRLKILWYRCFRGKFFDKILKNSRPILVATLQLREGSLFVICVWPGGTSLSGMGGGICWARELEFCRSADMERSFCLAGRYNFAISIQIIGGCCRGAGI